MLEAMGQAYPHLSELTRTRVLDPEYRFGVEFEFGLDSSWTGWESCNRGGGVTMTR
jgi:hypothetical protein